LKKLSEFNNEEKIAALAHLAEHFVKGMNDMEAFATEAKQLEASPELSAAADEILILLEKINKPVDSQFQILMRQFLPPDQRSEFDARIQARREMVENANNGILDLSGGPALG
jgi:hypothetical protein